MKRNSKKLEWMRKVSYDWDKMSRGEYRLPTFTFKESLFVVRGFGAMSAGSIGREEASRIGSSRAAAE
jgi:hypothetical protein